MNIETFMKNLSVPQNKIDVVLDTDTFNEVDDQFAVAYMLACKDKLNVKALYAAPFFNAKSSSPEDGMLKSYDELMRILKLAKREDLISQTYKGSTCYLKDEKTPVISDAANDLAKRAMEYSAENPLYVVAIGAITNVASAILINPQITENIVIVWLGGHSVSHCDTREFNMFQDVAAARVVFGCGAPFVQLPCVGVVDSFSLSYYEMKHFMEGKNELCDFLLGRVKENEECNLEKGCPVTRVIWDVTAVAWLMNENDKFMNAKLIHAPVPEYDDRYAYDDTRHFMTYVYHINRDNLAWDLYTKLADNF